jgi:hypothetical protein
MVVFYRESKMLGFAIGFRIKEGDQQVGGLPNGSSFIVQATPGTHTYTPATGGEQFGVDQRS